MLESLTASQDSHHKAGEKTGEICGHTLSLLSGEVNLNQSNEPSESCGSLLLEFPQPHEVASSLESKPIFNRYKYIQNANYTIPEPGFDIEILRFGFHWLPRLSAI